MCLTDDSMEFFVNFNQNSTSLAVRDKNGFSLFSLNMVDSSLEKIYTSSDNGIKIFAQYFNSSLIALVSDHEPRKLKMCHFKKRIEICTYVYSQPIVNVKMNHSQLVVCLEESLHIHNIRDMKVVHAIRDTPPNPRGLCALASDSDHCYLAYPGSPTVGQVQIFDAVTLQAKIMIAAHENPLAAITFNFAGTEVATASEKGTVIRVFSVDDGSKLFEFRRGVKRCVAISSLAFSTCSKYLCCSSNTETVHVFKLERVSPEATENNHKNDDWMGYFSKTLSSYIPTQVTDVFTQDRNFATAVLPTTDCGAICVMTTIQRSLKLLVATQNGFLYVYNVCEVNGSECKLIVRHNLREAAASAVKSQDVQLIGLKKVTSFQKSNLCLSEQHSSTESAASIHSERISGNDDIEVISEDETDTKSYQTNGMLICFQCGQPGHFNPNCDVIRERM